MVEDIHPRRLEILRFMAHREAAGEPASVREIGGGVGLSSSQTVYHHLQRLEADALIRRSSVSGASGRGAKSLRLTERGWEAVGETPLMGRIAAGRGMAAVVDGEAYALAGELLTSRSGRQRYLLRVVGQSMVDASIHDGDLVVVEADEDPPDGAIVVALLADEEVTVKRLYRQNGSVRLKAESVEHEDIVVPWGEVEIQGRVVASIHSF